MNLDTKNTLTTFVNGHLITLDDQYPFAKSVTVKNGRIAALDAPPSGKIIDLNGHVMIPGFCDAHLHLTGLGKSLEELNLKNNSSPNSIGRMVRETCRETPEGRWIFGRGWDQSEWETGAFPVKDILNQAAPDNPVVLTRVDGHAVWVNDTVCQKIGFDPSMSPPNGGQIINDCIFIDRSMDPIMSILPEPDYSDLKNWIRNAAHLLNSRGITSVHDAWITRESLKAIRDLIEEDDFPLFCYCMLASNDNEFLNEHFKDGIVTEDRLSIRAVKAFMDGALGSRGAALLEPYSDDAGNTGLVLMKPDEFTHLAKKCYRYGFQLNTHAIGDRGNRLVLDAYTGILGRKNDRRWRVEHAQMVADEDIPVFADYQIIPSMQPSHCTSDMRWLEERIGARRTSRISRIRTFTQMGLPVPGGSDCPIETGNPLLEFYAAVTRKDLSGNPENGWHSEEQIKPADALKMFTTWAAFSAFEENRRGRIRQGYEADFTVLSEDITSVPPENILSAQIIYTINKGTITFKADH